MDPELRRAMRNAASLVARLRPGETISREELIDALRAPLTDVEESPATLRHYYRHHILSAGLKNADAVVTYEEAAKLSGSTIDGLRSAAYRGQLVKLGTMNVEGDGRDRIGITLSSLAAFKRWPFQKFQEAAAEVARWREAEK